MVTITLIILVGAVGVFLTYVLIKRLSAKDLSGEQSDPGSTSNQTTESSENPLPIGRAVNFDRCSPPRRQ